MAKSRVSKLRSPIGAAPGRAAGPQEPTRRSRTPGPADSPQPPRRGLDRIEVLLFMFGVLAFAVLMLAFGQPLDSSMYLPLVGGWIVAGGTFIWCFHRYLLRRDR